MIEGGNKDLKRPLIVREDNLTDEDNKFFDED